MRISCCSLNYSYWLIKIRPAAFTASRIYIIYIPVIETEPLFLVFPGGLLLFLVRRIGIIDNLLFGALFGLLLGLLLRKLLRQSLDAERNLMIFIVNCSYPDRYLLSFGENLTRVFYSALGCYLRNMDKSVNSRQNFRKAPNDAILTIFTVTILPFSYFEVKASQGLSSGSLYREIFSCFPYQRK